MDSFKKSCSEAPPLIIENLVVGRNEGHLPIIDNVSLTVQPGEIRGLVGESGSGKSVTCLAALGLLGEGWTTEGRIRLVSAETAPNGSTAPLAAMRGSEAAMIFQDATASLNPIRRIGHQMTDTIAQLQQVNKAEAKRIALDLLRRVEIPEPEIKFQSYPFQLSGGQNQRVMIALALAGHPRILFADEPTTALDVTIQSQILSLLRSIRDETDMSVVFVTHDLGVVEEICDTVSVMYSGRIVETGKMADVIHQPQHPYTQGLVASMPTLKGRVPAGIPGQVPPPDERPSGCAFAPRCHRADVWCRQELPELIESDGRSVACYHPLEATDQLQQAQIEHILSKVRTTTSVDHLLTLRNAACEYRADGGNFRAIEGVSLTLNEGESLAIIGESGSGKSTIGKLILGMEPPAEGEVLFEGRPIPLLGTKAHRSYARSVQLIPQNPYLSLDPRATIGYQVAEPLTIHGIGTSIERSHRRDELLTAVGLEPTYAERYPHELSGGQCQRAVIARALCLGPKLLVCDEATASLDVSVQARIIALLRKLQGQFGLSLLFITHDLRLIRSLCQQVAVMRSGELVEIGTPQQVLTQPRHPYSQALIAAVPETREETA